MFIRDQRFPITDGTIIGTIRTKLIAKWSATGLSTGTKLPAIKTRRMVILRDDSGTAVGRTQPKRQGVNIWADDPIDALNMALDVLHIAEKDLPGVKLSGVTIISATSGFFGPEEITDEPQYVVASKNLTHYYVAFTATAKALAA